MEPSQDCTGGSAGCCTPDKPAVLRAEQLETWLRTSPAKPVTIHFSGKHSDPLASPDINKLAETAKKNCSMLSVSTIGLGLKQAHEHLPVDRWIFSIPAATEKSWEILRGNKRFNEAIEAIRTVRQNSRAMAEVVRTLWKASVNDIEIFNQLAIKENWQHTKVVFGRFDPEVNHFGRLENIALDHEASPYILRSDSLTLKKALKAAPLQVISFWMQQEHSAHAHSPVMNHHIPPHQIGNHGTLPESGSSKNREGNTQPAHGAPDRTGYCCAAGCPL